MARPQSRTRPEHALASITSYASVSVVTTHKSSVPSNAFCEFFFTTFF